MGHVPPTTHGRVEHNKRGDFFSDAGPPLDGERFFFFFDPVKCDPLLPAGPHTGIFWFSFQLFDSFRFFFVVF